MMQETAEAAFISSKRELSFINLAARVSYRMDDLVVAGVDIRSGSPRSNRRPLYSLSILRGERVAYEDEEVTLEEIFSLMRRFNVRVLATDNVYELAENVKSLRKFIQRMPPGSKLVQVTGSLGGIRSLAAIAREAGLPTPSHRDPLGTARVVARLAQRGVGVEIIAMYPETRVLITKNRSIKQGGSGSDRWRRSIEASILSEANRIATELDSANLDYDLYVERASGGLKRAEFIVYAGIDEVRRVVRESSEWTPLRVVLKQSWRSKVKFPSSSLTPLPRSRPIIVGIDPGMSVGLAVIDLDGNLLTLKTMRRASRSEIVEEILNHGYPVIIATDVSPPPKSVVRIASMFDSKLMVAKYDMKADEKKRIVSDYEEAKGIRVNSSHERDSLAAALKVYLRAKNLISKVKMRVREEGLTSELDRILTKVLKGTPISVAIEEILSERESESEIRDLSYAELKRELRRLNKYVRNLNERLAVMKKEVERKDSILRKREGELNRLRRKVEELEDRRIREIEVDRRISARDARIKELERELEREKWRNELLKSQMRQLASSREPVDGVRLRVLPSLSKDRVEELERDSYRDVLLILDASGASTGVLGRLKDLGVRAILYRGTPPPKEFLEKASMEGIVTASLDGFKISWRSLDPVLPSDEALRLLSYIRTEKTGERSGGEGGVDVMSIIRDYRMSLLRAVNERDTE